MKTLHVVLKHKWYNLIASGEKKEEYRELSEYWTKRLLVLTLIGQKISHYLGRIEEKHIVGFRDYDTICFHFGYTRTTMTFEIKEISIGQGNPEWGAEPGKNYFIIKLGNRK